jgi:hypothetical protein
LLANDPFAHLFHPWGGVQEDESVHRDVGSLLEAAELRDPSREVAELGDHSVPTSVGAPQDVARQEAPRRLALPVPALPVPVILVHVVLVHATLVHAVLVHAVLVHAEPAQRSQQVAQVHPHPTTRWVLHS